MSYVIEIHFALPITFQKDAIGQPENPRVESVALTAYTGFPVAGINPIVKTHNPIALRLIQPGHLLVGCRFSMYGKGAKRIGARRDARLFVAKPGQIKLQRDTMQKGEAPPCRILEHLIAETAH